MRVAGRLVLVGSAPIPPDPASPPYINGVARLHGVTTPVALLAALHAIEDGPAGSGPCLDAPRVARTLT